MLVLALQFSKGGRRGRACDSRSHGALRGSGSSAPCHRRGHDPTGRLPQNGREDKARRAGVSRGRILRL